MEVVNSIASTAQGAATAATKSPEVVDFHYPNSRKYCGIVRENKVYRLVCWPPRGIMMLRVQALLYMVRRSKAQQQPPLEKLIKSRTADSNGQGGAWAAAHKYHESCTPSQDIITVRRARSISVYCQYRTYSNLQTSMFLRFEAMSR